MSIEVIDAHFHVWQQADLPWLQGPSKPKVFGDYDSIKRDYLLDEYLKDLNICGLKKSVYVQANWPNNKYLDEVEWVSGLSERSGWPSAIVSYAHFSEGDIRCQLDRLAKFPLVRGVRQQLHWHTNPVFRFASAADQFNEDIFQRNMEYLIDYGYSFDLQIFPGQMAEGALLAAKFPAIRFVMVHSGMLEDTTTEGVMLWKQGMSALAKCPNVYVKLSGLGTFIHRNDTDHIANIVFSCIEMFGANRCMFGSNFPIEKIWTDFPDLLLSYRAALGNFTQEEQKAVFRDTAAKVYRL